MAVSNSLVQKSTRKLGITDYVNQEVIKNHIAKVLGGKNSTRFVTSIVSAVNANPQLQECDNGSIVAAALVGEALNLSPSPTLGHYYMVPYNDKDKGKVAQFQLGYKGYIQLAIRSGQYKRLNVLAIKEGELIKFNPLTEEIEVRLIEDEEERENAPTIGYYAMFEYTNGFRKAIYWSRKKMEAHALKYSKGYAAKKGYTYWEKDFDGMGYKTMLRHLISRWGIMSIDMMTAFDSDMTIINEDGTRTYVENEEIIEGTAAEVKDPEPEPVKAPEPTAQEEDEITQMLFGGDNV